MEIRISSEWKEKVCGLCGNYNGDKDDEYVSPLGVPVSALCKPHKKSWKTFFTLPFIIYSIPICKIYEVNHLSRFFFSKMTPPRSQLVDSGLSNSLEQADGSQK